MSATGKAGEVLNVAVTVRESGKKPDFRKTAGFLLKMCREFYEDPENEKAFREWKATKEKKGA